MTQEDKNTSYYHCGKCTEDVCLVIECPCCGHYGHESESEPVECAHENDGLIYCSNPPQNKCKKCGVFYRNILR